MSGEMDPRPRDAAGSDPKAERLRQLTLLFGSYKAEWLKRQMYDLFARPVYFPYLNTNQSCVLIGGRGTGKTTVLRGLSYEGKQRLDASDPATWDSYGIYYKVDSNRLSSFTGLGRSDEEWQRPFAHYLNLLFADLAMRFLVWFQANGEGRAPFRTESATWRRFERELDLTFPDERTYTLAELAGAVQDSFVEFTIYVNNIDDDAQERPRLSIAGGALDALFEAIGTLPGLEGKEFYLLIDEYESFADYQQRVFNTLIKQSAGRQYCFKVGVRELGWRERYTLNNQELRDPSDYRRIDIAKELSGADFNEFARDVFSSRLAKLLDDGSGRSQGSVDPRELFPGLTIYEEAVELGVKRLAAPHLRAAESLPDAERAEIEAVHPALVWFVVEWGKRRGWPVIRALRELATNRGQWEYRFDNNYGYSSLFAIRRGKVRKYYAGWDVYLKLASGNIRFFLQLVEEALREHILADRPLHRPIRPSDQSRAARNVGRRNFEELEGLDLQGSKIMRLLLGVGRLFQILAWDPFGHAPEMVQFSLDDGDQTTSTEEDQAAALLMASVNHLALQRSTGTKLGRKDPRGFDYWIHPIYSAFFQIGHRRKRKMTLDLEDVHELYADQKSAIARILERHGRAPEQVDEVPLPPQLDLFFPTEGAEGS